MKNFKKVLALALAVVMLLSFATVASAASVTSDWYEDVEDIDYKEAVDVLGMIGVMEGYPDDTFRPDKTITRAEAAKIIAMFDNGSASINGLYTSANPFTDCVDHWAESFIAYGAKTGIISGMGDATKFMPENNVTGVQFLKMVLVVLGYDAKTEGLTGSSWDVNTLALAKRVGLTASLGVKFDYSADLKRQEAAVIMLDALRAETVVYGSALGVNVSKFNSAVNDWLDNATTNPYQFEGLSINGAVYMTVAGAVKTGELLGEEWGLEEGYTEDAFYRPYRTWELDGTVIGEYMYPVLAEYTIATNGCEVLADIGVAKSNASKSVTAEHYVNGNTYNDVTLQHNVVTTTVDCAAEEVDFGGQGTLTQVFYLNAAAAKALGVEAGYRITEIETWLGQVTDVVKKTTNKDGHLVSAYNVEIEPVTGNGNVHDAFDCLAGTTVVATDTDGLKEGEYVLFSYSAKAGAVGAYYVESATYKSGKFDGFKDNSYPSQTRFEGAYIPDSYHFHLGYTMSKTAAQFGTKTVFFDRYDNIIGMVDSVADFDYVVIDKMWVEYSKGDASLHANIVDIDAKTSTDVVIDTITLANGTEYDADGVANLANVGNINDELEWSQSTWFKNRYNKLFKAEGEYDLTRVTNSTTVGQYAIYIDADTSKMTIADNNTLVYADKDTKFLIHENDGSYTAVTGINNMPTISATHVEYIADNTGLASVVYLYGVITRTEDTFTAYVGHNSSRWVEGNYTHFEVYLNGVKTELCTYGTDVNELFPHDGFYDFTVISVGDVKVVSTPVATTTAAYTTMKQVTGYANGTLLVAGEGYVRVADNVVVYEISVDGDVEVVDFDADEIVDHDCYIVYDAAGKIAVVYVVDTIAD